MDCGDTGHILLSKRVAGDLAPHPRWNAGLHELDEFEVKHGRKKTSSPVTTGEHSTEAGCAFLQRPCPPSN